VPGDKVDVLFNRLKKNNVNDAAIIGEVIKEPKERIVLK